MLSRDDARSILQKALSYSRSDEAEATLGGGNSANIRFARNQPTTTGSGETAELSYTAVFGKRVGSASTSDLEDGGLRNVVKKAEELARVAPESPEYMPRLGPQKYLETPTWDKSANEITSGNRANIARAAIDAAKGAGVEAAGYFEQGESFSAIANSHGLFGYSRGTSVDYSLTMRSSDGNGSGWAAASSQRRGGVVTETVTARSLRKATESRNPVQLEPGEYPVVLEPSCTGDMLQLLYWNLGRRGADEGRSFFSNTENGTRIGEALFDSRISIYSDPTHRDAPSTPWGDDGLPLARTAWISEGVLRNLAVGRYWAEKKGLPVIPMGSNVIMEGGSASIDDLVASIDHGLLVSSFWYIRTVDPRTILHTGLTRDGLVLIEKGKIPRPVVNFRWNESPASIFSKTEMLGVAERVVTREGNLPMMAPPIKASAFRFTSVSPST
jgi:predicted Zn-dependent protease